MPKFPPSLVSLVALPLWEYLACTYARIGYCHISKSILESKTFPCHSTAKNLLQPFVDILQKAKEFALVEKRDHLKTCFVQDKDVDKDCQPVL
jgi:hypothetical protein